MGGLTTLLYLKNDVQSKVKAYINIEGNLLPEDCMFSSKVVTYDFETFANEVFPKIILDMKANGNTGYHIIANNLQLTTMLSRITIIIFKQWNIQQKATYLNNLWH